MTLKFLEMEEGISRIKVLFENSGLELTFLVDFRSKTGTNKVSLKKL